VAAEIVMRAYTSRGAWSRQQELRSIHERETEMCAERKMVSVILELCFVPQRTFVLGVGLQVFIIRATGNLGISLPLY
jgi:hypothetical protein